MSEPGWGSEWNITIKAMPLPMYLDWVLAKRPGFEPPDNLRLQQWVRTWKVAEAGTRVPHKGRVA